MADGLVQTRLTVRVTWDPEARVWIALSDDIDGFVMEHKSFDALMEEMPEIVSILLKANHGDEKRGLPIHVLADRIEEPVSD